MIVATESEGVLDIVSRTLDVYYDQVLGEMYSEKVDLDTAKSYVDGLGKKVAGVNGKIAHSITRKVPETNKDGTYRVNFNTDYDAYAKRVKRTETALLAAEIPVAMTCLPKPLDLVLVGSVAASSPAAQGVIKKLEVLKGKCADLAQKIRSKKVDDKTAITQMKTLNMQIAKAGKALQATT